MTSVKITPIGVHLEVHKNYGGYTPTQPKNLKSLDKVIDKRCKEVVKWLQKERESMDMYGNVLIGLSGIRASRLLQEEIDKVKAKRSLVDNCEVYVNLNEGVTILKHGNSVYKSKSENLSEFDVEKGVMIGLLKAVGIRTSDYLKVLEGVKYSSKSKKIKNSKCAIKCKKDKCKCKKGN